MNEFFAIFCLEVSLHTALSLALEVLNVFIQPE